MSCIKNIILKNKVTVQSSLFSRKNSITEIAVQILVGSRELRSYASVDTTIEEITAFSPKLIAFGL